jgi:nucleotide sugar dehydrogenase
LELIRAIDERTARVCVVGLGYVGLPLALRIAECGYPVPGLDTDGERVEHISSKLPPREGSLAVTSDASALGDADIVLLCVPTPIKDDLPDMSHIEEAARAVSAHLRPGHLVVLESTSYPGTTEDLLRSILEDSGLTAGRDFLMGFSPKRIDPGNTEFTLSNTPKVVGGIDHRSAEAMSAFYGSLVKDVVRVSSPAVAEMANC